MWLTDVFIGPGWDAGRPWYAEDPVAKEDEIDKVRRATDASFEKTKSLSLPPVDSTLKVCNGLDVVNRTVFDHMWGWYTVGRGFSFDLGGAGVPYVTGACGRMGGKPESIDPQVVKGLETQRLYINNIHYQGYSKDYMAADLCRVLLLTGERRVVDPVVANMCAEEQKKNPTWACRDHKDFAERKPDICAWTDFSPFFIRQMFNSWCDGVGVEMGGNIYRW